MKSSWPTKGRRNPVNLCEVCGAKVRNLNPKCKTCSPLCTEAKKNGRTMKEQMEHDLKKMWK